jgi:hypothetical protein
MFFGETICKLVNVLTKITRGYINKNEYHFRITLRVQLEQREGHLGAFGGIVKEAGLEQLEGRSTIDTRKTMFPITLPDLQLRPLHPHPDGFRSCWALNEAICVYTYYIYIYMCV